MSVPTNWYFDEAMKLLLILHKENNVPWEFILLKLNERIEPLIPKEKKK